MLPTNVLTNELFDYVNFAHHFCRHEGKFKLHLTFRGLEAPTLQVPAARKTQQGELLHAYFGICSSHHLLTPAKNHTHTSQHDLSLPSLLAAAFLQEVERTQEITGRSFLLPRRGRVSQDEPTALSFPRRDRGHFLARPELNQASTSAIPLGALPHQLPFQGAMAIN